MLKTFDTHSKVGMAAWWTAAALLPLALMGCQPRTPVQSQANSPEERVAGERQEQGDSETMRVVQEASLPATFAFGGRTWRAHQVHWIDPNADKEADRTESIGTTAVPGGDRSGAPGTTSTDVAPGTGKPDDNDDEKGMGGFVPVATFTISGHQIYRRSDADEAVTDNIYLRAENVRPPAPTTGNEATGTSPDAAATEGAVSSTETSTRMAFVEYDAADNLLENVELSRVIQATGLPETVQYGGKTWKADEVQVYDPDVFDDLKAAPQQINGYPALMGDEKDEIWLQADLDPTMLNTTAGTGTTESPGSTLANQPASEGTAPAQGTTGSPGEAMAGLKGPIFIKYDAQ